MKYTVCYNQAASWAIGLTLHQVKESSGGGNGMKDFAQGAF